MLDPGDCTTEARWGLRVTVRDERNGLPAGFGAIVTARAPGYTETLQAFPDSLNFAGAIERSGDYDVTITKPGYQAWSRTGVEVGEGHCHVDTATLDARIRPVSSAAEPE